MFEKTVSLLIILFILVGIFNITNGDINSKYVYSYDLENNNSDKDIYEDIYIDKSYENAINSFIKYDEDTGTYIFYEGDLTDIGDDYHLTPENTYVSNNDTTDNSIIEDIVDNSNSNDEKFLSEVRITQGLYESGKTKYYPFHVGVDYGLKYDEIYSFTENLKVKGKGHNYYFGNYIILVKGNKLYSLQHLKSFGNYNVGDTLKKGELLGITGNTGANITGAHLHVEMYYKGQLMDENIVNKELKCLVNSNINCIEDDNIKYNDVSFRKILKENKLYNNSYDDFFNIVESISEKYNFPEKTLLALKISTGLKFSDIESKLTGNIVDDTDNIRKLSKRKYSLIAWHLSCLQSKHKGEVKNCDNYQYGKNSYTQMMYDLYDHKNIKNETYNNVSKEQYMTNPSKEKVIKNTLDFFLRSNIESLRLEAFPDGNDGRYSIGVGTISFKGEVITKEEAMNRAIEDLHNRYDNALIGYHENIQTALLSYKFNRGHYPSNWKKYLEKGDFDSLLDSFNNEGLSKEIMDKYGNGLNNRRNEEKKLIISVIK